MNPHYAAGLLAGLVSLATALAAMRNVPALPGHAAAANVPSG